jgi:hypothetical protein
MLCGSFSESKEKKLRVSDLQIRTFVKTLDIWCGRGGSKEMELCEVQQLASVADRFQITEVLSALEESVMKQLSVEGCGEVLMWSGGFGMRRLEADALNMATWRFEEFVRTAGFMRLGEEALSILLDDDLLVARSEEAVWEAVVQWNGGMAGKVGWRGVVGKIRFPLMGEEYLRNRVAGMVSGEDGEWMAGVVAEALRAKAARREGATLELELLGRKAVVDRVWPGVRWEEYTEGGELRLEGHRASVTAIVACDGRICSGAWDGSIRVWSRASGGHERTLHETADQSENAFSLAVWGDRLISGHLNGKLQVWDVATGDLEQVLEGHSGSVFALAVCGSRLASGCGDGLVRVWRMGAGAAFASERSLLGHTGQVASLAAWQDKVASGSLDGSIRVWDVGTGAHDATLAGHSGAVRSLVLHGDRLLSAAGDGTIRAWAVGTWVALRTVEAYREGARQQLWCLAVSGSKLVSGTWARYGAHTDGSQMEVRVWGLEELDLQRTLAQPAGSSVGALAVVDGEVWGGAGREVVVWGRKAWAGGGGGRGGLSGLGRLGGEYAEAA